MLLLAIDALTKKKKFAGLFRGSLLVLPLCNFGASGLTLSLFYFGARGLTLSLSLTFVFLPVKDQTCFSLRIYFRLTRTARALCFLKEIALIPINVGEEQKLKKQNKEN